MSDSDEVSAQPSADGLESKQNDRDEGAFQVREENKERRTNMLSAESITSLGKLPGGVAPGLV